MSELSISRLDVGKLSGPKGVGEGEERWIGYVEDGELGNVRLDIRDQAH